jgi:Holliday junction resolvase
MKKTVRSRTITITKNKISKNNQRAAKTRRQRGYQWEDTLVKRFKKTDGWKAFRLGSPSTGLPDVLAVNTNESKIFSIEAKSGTGTSLIVPYDQIERCLEWVKTFDIYKNRMVLLAFKFSSKKRIAVGKYENRELREYFKIWNDKQEISDIICNYNGEVFMKKNSKRESIDLKECKMPFKTKQRTSANLE